AHIGVGTFAIKIVSALTIFVDFAILQYCGYIPNSPEQPEAVITALYYLIAGVPIVVTMIIIVMYLFYPLTKEKHDAIRAEIDQRHQNALKENH
ncbi:MAG: MFS transporter, partial [Coxiellaceae bacterium]|nr:MFS transporter [Coxiellaceae bacterium]